MANIPASQAATMRANQGTAPRCLLELQTVDGTRLYIADGAISVLSAIGAFDVGGATVVAFNNWLIDPPQFADTGTLVTSTATAVFQNISGNTIERDGSVLFTTQKLWGAVFVFRLWDALSQFALRTYIGNVTDVELDDTQVSLSLQKSSNWSEIPAPDCNIDPSCQLTFGSPACGSTSPTPCQNTYGTCSQLNRFKGVVTIWETSAITVGQRSGVAQPAPVVDLNNRRPG